MGQSQNFRQYQVGKFGVVRGKETLVIRVAWQTNDTAVCAARVAMSAASRQDVRMDPTAWSTIIHPKLTN